MAKSQFKNLLRNTEKKSAAEKPWEKAPLAAAVREEDGRKENESAKVASAPEGGICDSNTRPGTGHSYEPISGGSPSSSSDGTIVEEKPGPDPVSLSGSGSGESGSKKVIYTDKSVCNMLRIKRRILAEARTEKSRGVDWDAVGEEVGMTKEWCDNYALLHGICPNFAGGVFEEVKGRYISCKLCGTTPNRTIVQVELEASKKRQFARVRNISMFPIHYGEVFTCIINNGFLEWFSEPNEVRY